MKKLFYSFIVAMVCVAATGCGSKSSNSADGTEVASSGDIDGFLDAYEDAMDTYVDIAQRASSGDASALADMAEAQAKMTEAADRLSSSEEEMTEAQAERLAEIAAKAAQAAR